MHHFNSLAHDLEELGQRAFLLMQGFATRLNDPGARGLKQICFGFSDLARRRHIDASTSREYEVMEADQNHQIKRLQELIKHSLVQSRIEDDEAIAIINSARRVLNPENQSTIRFDEEVRQLLENIERMAGGQERGHSAF
jgi:hypothetical protein